MAEQETLKTTREQWQEFSDAVQDEVDGQLEELAIDIEAVNLKVAELHYSDPKAAQELLESTIQYLDSKWGYMGDYFMVTGTWHEPMGATDQETIMVRHQKKEAFRTCVSDGFAATVGSEGVPPRIGMSFIVAGVNYYSPTMRGSLELLAIGEMNEISLQFMRFGNEKIESASIEEVTMTLMRAQSTFDLYINHEGSNFYQQSAKKQEAFLRSLIESVQDVLPAPNALEALQIQDAITPEFYVKNPDGDGLVMFRELKKGHPFAISGQVVGVNVHDLLVDGPGVYYSSRDELDAAQTGLCLMVKPSSINFPIDQYVKYDGSYLLLPLEKIQSLPLTLERTA